MAEYLTCYDYGTGGVWLYVEAASAAEIRNTYPELTVFEAPPKSWDAENEALTRQHNFRDAFWQEWLSKFEVAKKP
jgi:hypothetical protein